MDFKKNPEGKKNQSWFSDFLHDYRNYFYLFFMMISVFGCLFLLADLPWVFFYYAIELCSFFFFIWLAFKAVRYHENSVKLRKLIDYPLDQLGSLYLAETAQEKHYEKEIHHLIRHIQHLKKEQREQQTDQLDYFTLWLHQIKTPISSLSLLMQQNREEFPVSREVEKELIRIENYTHMALGYMKLEQPGEELHLEKVSIDRIVKRVIKRYALVFVSKRITLDYVPIEEEIITDAQWLELLLEQLISNSLKYTPNNGKVSVTLNQNWELEIQDTGIGIRPEDIPKIFERGYSGWNARRTEKSTGLGLFLSKKICSRLGFKLSVQSDLSKGTKMMLDLKQPQIELYD